MSNVSNNDKSASFWVKLPDLGLIKVIKCCLDGKSVYLANLNPITQRQYNAYLTLYNDSLSTNTIDWAAHEII
jgi:hypothetical protein